MMYYYVKDLFRDVQTPIAVEPTKEVMNAFP